MNDRIKKLKSRIITKDGLRVSSKRLKLQCEAERNSKDEPRVLVRAKIFDNVMRNIPIHILPDELIVGTPSSSPWGLEVDETLDTWDQDELIGLREWGTIVTDEDIKTVLDLNREFEPFSMYAGANLVVGENDLLNKFVQTGLCLAPWKPKITGSRKGRVGAGGCNNGLGLSPAWTLMCINWNLPIYKGFEAMIKELDEEIQKNEYFENLSYERGITLQAMKICLESVIYYANRHADLASELAVKEKEPKRAKELLEIAEICRRVPAKPARNFREAMQSLWFVFLGLTPCGTGPLGRFDQYMYPLFKADKDAGRITDEDVIELLSCLRIRIMELQGVAGRELRKRSSGGAAWYNMTIGGVKPDGSDATNELSYLILDTVLDCRTPHHTVTIRVADSTPQELLLKGIECQAKGCSMPAFVSDDNYIKFFTTPNLSDPGLPLEVARDFCITGCIDGNIPGKTRSMSVSMFIAPLVLDIFLNSGECKNTGLKIGHDADLESFDTFDKFYEAFKNEWGYYIKLAVQKNNIENIVVREQYPDPFRSVLMDDGIKVGLDMHRRRLDFENSSLLNSVGFINLSQSIYAIKKLCYDDKVISLNDLKKVMDANWEGHEDLRQKCLKLPHYGNDIDEVDNVVVDLYKFYHDEVCKHPTPYGGYTRTNAISVSAHEPGGSLTGATPDGRFKGEVLADANASPIRGFDKKGPLAVFRSAMKIDQCGYQAFLINMKFHPSALQSKDDYTKLATAIKTYFKGGGEMIQFNVVDVETLKEAQKKPEQHGDLMVRVAGYSAYFVKLTPGIQGDIINRTEHKF